MVAVALIVVCVGFTMRGVNDGGVFLDRWRAMAMRVIVMLDRVAARMPGMGADNRDEPGENSADQRQEYDSLIHAAQPFIRLTSSTAIEPRLRKYTTSTASPIAASAAATVSTSSANTWPTMSPRNDENATRLMLTASRISSIDIRMTMMFLRLRKIPRIPSVNRIAPTAR